MPTRTALSVLAAATCIVAAGCDRASDPGPRPSPPPPAVEFEAGLAQLTGRGEVIAVAADAITIRNEAIAAHPMGDAEPGLDPTERAYTLDDGVAAEGLSAGDPVEFTFSISADAPDEPVLLSITRLDPGAELDFTSLTRTYQTRGIVVAIPLPGEERNILIKHEAIPTYRAPHGETGMDVMSMLFPLAEDLSIDAIKIGDKVALSFYVEYREDHVPLWYEVTTIEKLAPSTQLDYTPLGG